MKYTSFSEKDTKQFAQNLAKNLKINIVALTGELGAGKTTFTQGFAKGLGIKDKIISPTFVLIRQHKIPNSEGIFYHIDLYRLEDDQISKGLGLKDLWSNKENIVLIEWAEKIKKFLPENTVWINIEKDKDKRLISIS